MESKISPLAVDIPFGIALASVGLDSSSAYPPDATAYRPVYVICPLDA